MGVLKARSNWVPVLAWLAALPLATGTSFLISAAHSADEIESAMLYNFVKFVEWPAGALGGTGAPVTVCVMGGAMVPVLEAALRNKAVDGHPIGVRRLDASQDPRSCQILYVRVSDRKEAAKILQAARLAPILTIGERAQFSRQGGVIAFIRDGRRIRFEINLDAAERAGLQISSKLLQLAAIWREDAAQAKN